MPSLVEQSTSLCDTKYKIVFLGDMGVGKTSIIQRFVKDQFDICNNPTVGIDFLTRNIAFQSNEQIQQYPKLWDTAGQQKYKSLVPAYLRDANCAVFVFDFTRPETFQNLDNWIQIYRDHCPENTLGIILGNKHETLKQNNLPVDTQTQNNNLATQTKPKAITDFELFSEQYSRKQSMFYLKVSAKTGQNVLRTFQTIIFELNKSVNSLQNSMHSTEIESEDIKVQNQLLEKFKKLKLDGKNRESQKNNCCYI